MASVEIKTIRKQTTIIKKQIIEPDEVIIAIPKRGNFERGMEDEK